MRNESTVIGQLLVRRTPPFDPFPLELLSAKTVRRLIGVSDRSDMAYGFSGLQQVEGLHSQNIV